ncbi:hypothetical protein CPB97_001427 [Podila verticillata]|nr:hypothetical protein CPB97_001427 [Podila verticillata]
MLLGRTTPYHSASVGVTVAPIVMGIAKIQIQELSLPDLATVFHGSSVDLGVEYHCYRAVEASPAGAAGEREGRETEKKREAYLRAVDGRAIIRKAVWAMVADQIRGARNTNREKEMMEQMFGSVVTGAEQRAKTDAPTRGSGAVELLNWIEGPGKATGTEAPSRDLTVGEEHDLNRARWMWNGHQ